MYFDTEKVVGLEKGKTGRVNEIKIKSSSPVGDFGADQKERVTAHSMIKGEEGEREMKLVVKTLDRDVFIEIGSDEVPADKYMEFRQRLVDAGIPTVPSIRKISSNEVAMTDLTADGSGLYGKNRDYQLIDEPVATDKFFRSLDFTEVFREVREIIDKADKASIVIPQDDPFELLVHPDGTWNLIILDVSQLETARNPSIAHTRNIWSQRLFEDYLREIKRKIK